MMEILTVNIGRPSIDRGRSLLTWLNDHASDVTVLTEVSTTAGSQLILDAYRAAGYVISVSDIPEGGRGVAIITASAPVAVRNYTELGERALSVTINLEGEACEVLGIYAPSSDPSHSVTSASLDRKRSWFASFAETLSSTASARKIVIGDLNIADPRVPNPPRWLSDFEHDFFAGLASVGLADWSLLEPSAAGQYSWVGRGNQHLRFDYVFGSSDLKSDVSYHRYIQDVRERRLTDHAGLRVGLTGSPSLVRPTTPIVEVGSQLPLF